MPDETKLTTILKDSLGSTDALYTGTWNGGVFSTQTTEYQSFDTWGERRDPVTLANYRASEGDAFRGSGHDYNRGYTGHEQLDDSGIIHMNGRLYDPELGRMLSPDPYVQVPEYSQNFNRYSYVMNNPLNMTDPTGFSWVSKAFHKMGSWLKGNWRAVVSIVASVALFFVLGPGAFGYTGMQLQGAQLGFAAGATSGAANAAINGGNSSDILTGGVVGGIQGGITSGILHPMEGDVAEAGFFSSETAMHVAGHGVVGGTANYAMGGKFEDGFISAAVSAGAADAGLLGDPDVAGSTAIISRTMRAGVLGGTVSAIGGGKFANGAWTASFQHLLNNELPKKLPADREWRGVRLDYSRGSGELRYWDHLQEKWISLGRFDSGHFGVTDETIKGKGPTPKGSYRIYTRGRGVAWAHGQPGYILDPVDSVPYNDKWDGGPASGRGNLRIHAGVYQWNQSEGCLIASPERMGTIHAILKISETYSPYTRTISNDWKNETALGTLRIH